MKFSVLLLPAFLAVSIVALPVEKRGEAITEIDQVTNVAYYGIKDKRDSTLELARNTEALNTVAFSPIKRGEAITDIDQVTTEAYYGIKK